MFPNSSYRSSDLVSMDTFLINKNTLLKLVDDCLIRGGSDFTRDILIPGLDRLDIRGYEYDRPAYKIDTLEGYFKANMAFLDNEIRDMMINGEGPVYTKVRDEVPARYSHSSKVSNSLLSDGCIVEGTVKNSILFRSVQISRGAVIKNCVIMQGSQVQANAVLENVILDKNCTVTRGRRLTGTESFPVVIKKGSTV
jgi:glucose-1-phosphate adenylyltransferase